LPASFLAPNVSTLLRSKREHPHSLQTRAPSIPRNAIRRGSQIPPSPQMRACGGFPFSSSRY
jgi:hypothetical protein